MQDGSSAGSGLHQIIRSKVKSDLLHLRAMSLEEILPGLRKKQKELHPKYFYDSKGSSLFARICETEEYYVTRTEEKILKENISEISSAIGDNVLLVEFGSGNSSKTKLLLENADITGYVPVDISYDHLMEAVIELKDIFPDLKIYPVPADYTGKFELPETNHTFSRTSIFFPGSTIGNFSRTEASSFLGKSLSIIKHGGMLIGFDLIKDKRIIENAYNDRQGLTAEFNLNILSNINTLTGSDFNVNEFEHLAFYNEYEKRVEMHLVSKSDQVITLGEEKIKIAKGENIITEYSHKFAINDIKELVKGYYNIGKIWTDKNRFFALLYITPLNLTY
jgi:dimethylhistidine N-methyltransferase